MLFPDHTSVFSIRKLKTEREVGKGQYYFGR
jgi:hypothetical protein